MFSAIEIGQTAHGCLSVIRLSSARPVQAGSALVLIFVFWRSRHVTRLCSTFDLYKVDKGNISSLSYGIHLPTLWIPCFILRVGSGSSGFSSASQVAAPSMSAQLLPFQAECVMKDIEGAARPEYPDLPLVVATWPKWWVLALCSLPQLPLDLSVEAESSLRSTYSIWGGMCFNAAANGRVC